MRILDLKNGEESTVRTVLELSRLDQVEAKHVEWLWQNRLARGKLTLLAGEPGIGKSQTVIDIIARISNGRFLARRGARTAWQLRNLERRRFRKRYTASAP